MKDSFYRMLLSIPFLFALCAAPSSAQRIGSKNPTAPHELAVMISPFHLLLPMVVATAEFRMNDDVGMAGVVGAGSVLGFTTFELGAQGNYYLIGGFDHGMQVGAELLYSYSSGDIGDSSSISFSGTGLAFGPYLGYKVAAGFGLTFNLQAGLGVILARGSAEEKSSGRSGSGTGGGVVPLLNLNLGWSF
jgi:hypothetical protein